MIHTTSRVLHAIADRLLVDIESDESSASCNTSRSSGLSIQTTRPSDVPGSRLLDNLSEGGLARRLLLRITQTS
jgi:hypothetical protein